MISKIKELLRGKNILILGFGREGQSSFRLLKKMFPEARPGIADSDETLPEKHPHLEGEATLYCGNDYLQSCSDYELVIKTPGIPYDRVLPHSDAARITSQTDLFLQAFSDQVIGVTGTKGKSTTTTLIHHILQSSGRKTYLSGNIGIPPFDMAEKVEQDALVVFEMSSHQLEHISVAPHIAVLLNVFPEHLDHYHDFTAYKMAKFNIYKMQPHGSTLIYNADDPLINDLLDGRQDGIITSGFSAKDKAGVDAFLRDDNIILHSGENDMLIPLSKATDLPGRHNRMNMMAALLVCSVIGLSKNNMMGSLATYRRPEHRLEHAGTYRGIRFFNDSIATIPEATVEALHTLGHVDLLILGGHDRGLDYSLLYDRLSTEHVPHIIFMGEAGKRMMSEIRDGQRLSSACYLAEGMEQAFTIIGEQLEDGNVCLLSPAAASYGLFRNFEERGAIFKKMAAAL